MTRYQARQCEAELTQTVNFDTYTPGPNELGRPHFAAGCYSPDGKDWGVQIIRGCYTNHRYTPKLRRLTPGEIAAYLRPVGWAAVSGYGPCWPYYGPLTRAQVEARA